MAHKTASHTFQKPLDEILQALAPRLEKTASFASLKRTLDVRLAKELTKVLQEKTTEIVHGTSCTMGSKPFDSLLRTMHARGWITQRPCPKQARVQKPYWTITPSGAKHFAQLQAID